MKPWTKDHWTRTLVLLIPGCPTAALSTCTAPNPLSLPPSSTPCSQHHHAAPFPTKIRVERGYNFGGTPRRATGASDTQHPCDGGVRHATALVAPSPQCTSHLDPATKNPKMPGGALATLDTCRPAAPQTSHASNRPLLR